MVEHFVSCAGQIGGLPDLFDRAILDEKTTIRELGVVVIEGEQVGMFDEQDVT